VIALPWWHAAGGSGGGSGLLADVQAIPEVVAIFAPDPATLYTDAGTTNVAVDGDAVQEWHCAQGSGVVLALSGSGITYESDGSFIRVESNGDGTLQGDIPDTWDTPMLLAAAFQAPNDFAPVFGVTNPNTDDEANYVAINPPEPNVGALAWTPNGSGWSSAGAVAAADTPFVVQGAFTTNSVARVDGVDQSAYAEVAPVSADSIAAMFGFVRSGSDIDPPSTVYGAVICDGIPSAADRDVIDQWLASLCGVTL